MLDTEPDAASDGFGFAPRLLVSLDALRATGLIQPGSLVDIAYKVRLAVPAGDDATHGASATAPAQNSREAGWSDPHARPTRRRRCPPTSSASRSS